MRIKKEKGADKNDKNILQKRKYTAKVSVSKINGQLSPSASRVLRIFSFSDKKGGQSEKDKE